MPGPVQLLMGQRATRLIYQPWENQRALCKGLAKCKLGHPWCSTPFEGDIGYRACDAGSSKVPIITAGYCTSALCKTLLCYMP